jgi:hypothetical protein
MFTAPTALRAIRKDDPNAELLLAYKDRVKKSFKFVGLSVGDCHDSDLTIGIVALPRP